jgi:cell division protein FtsL
VSLGWLTLLWAAVLVSAAGAIYAKYRSRMLFVQLQRLNHARQALDDEWGRMQLEQGAWSSYGYVERIAGGRLHMSTPDPADIRIVVP